MIYNLTVSSGKEAAEAMYRFLSCGLLHNREVNFSNPDPKLRPEPGYMFPPDMFIASYRDDCILDFDEFESKWKESAAAAGVASFDEADGMRVTFAVIPPAPPGIRYVAVLNTFDYADHDIIEKLILYLQGG